MELGLLAYANALTNIQQIYVNIANLTNGMFTSLGTTGALVASGNIPTLTQMVAMQSYSTDVANPATIQPSIYMRIQSGQTVSGSLDLVGLSVRRAPLIA